MIRMAALIVLLSAAAVQAHPVRYALQRDQSVVGFSWFLGREEVKGRMPVASANLLIDLERVERSRVDVTLDARAADAGFPFASQAMKGPKVLDAARHPALTFAQTRAVRTGPTTVRIEGDLSIRGVTRPVVLDAQLYRQRGSDPHDLSHLSILLTGSISRAAYGATGWSDMAGDTVKLSILARMERAE